MEEVTATLIVGRSSSKCSNCNKDADYNELTHEHTLGYFPGPGCGARFTKIISYYVGTKEVTMALRPDLEWENESIR